MNFKDRKWLVIIILLVSLPLISLKWYEFKYAEKDLNFTMEGVAYNVENYDDFQEIEMEFVGTEQVNKTEGEENIIIGEIEFEDENYPVNMILDKPYNYIYMYQINGTYFGTLKVYPNFEKMILYKVSDENIEELKHCNRFFVFSRQGVDQAKDDLEHLVRKMEPQKTSIMIKISAYRLTFT